MQGARTHLQAIDVFYARYDTRNIPHLADQSLI